VVGRPDVLLGRTSQSIEAGQHSRDEHQVSHVARIAEAGAAHKPGKPYGRCCVAPAALTARTTLFPAAAQQFVPMSDPIRANHAAK
jgi:hypothetical protein